MAGNYPSYRVQSASAGSFAGVRRFFRWWWRELSALIPVGLWPLPLSTKRFLWVDFSPGQAVVYRVAETGLDEIGRVDLAAQDVAARKLAFSAIARRFGRMRWGICVPAAQILRTTITLPLAARDNLRQVIGFELGRHTPFNTDQAWYDHRIMSSARSGGHLDVAVTVAAKRPIEAAVSVLTECGIQPQAAVPMDELSGTPRYADFLPPALRPRMTLATKLVYGVLILVPFLLLGASLALPLWQKRETAIELNARMTLARQQADAIGPLRAELERVGAKYQFLLEKKASRPPVVALLEDVTRILTDDTWLTQLEIKSGELVMNGETSSSSSLVRLMERSTWLEEAAFRSPLVKGRNNVERFQLAAKIREIGLAEALAAQKARVAAKMEKRSSAKKGAKNASH